MSKRGKIKVKTNKINADKLTGLYDKFLLKRESIKGRKIKGFNFKLSAIGNKYS
tara:strand:+ start:271 stop:432 length:162 start_codon:yes stop_codon:yes gene_type:complete